MNYLLIEILFALAIKINLNCRTTLRQYFPTVTSSLRGTNIAANDTDRKNNRDHYDTRFSTDLFSILLSGLAFVHYRTSMADSQAEYASEPLQSWFL